MLREELDSVLDTRVGGDRLQPLVAGHDLRHHDLGPLGGRTLRMSRIVTTPTSRPLSVTATAPR